MARTMSGVFMFSVCGEKKPRLLFGCRGATKERFSLLKELFTETVAKDQPTPRGGFQNN